MASTSMTPLWKQTSREKIATCIARMDLMRKQFPDDYRHRTAYEMNLQALEAACRSLLAEADGSGLGTAAAGAVAATVQG